MLHEAIFHLFFNIDLLIYGLKYCLYVVIENCLNAQLICDIAVISPYRVVIVDLLILIEFLDFFRHFKNPLLFFDF